MVIIAGEFDPEIYPNPLQFDTMKRADRAVIASPPDATRVIVAAASGPAVAAARERRMG